MTLSINTKKYFVLSNYIDSLWNANPVKFASLLAPNATLTHFTNDVEDHKVSGMQEIVALFSKNFFTSLVSMDVSRVKFDTSGCVGDGYSFGSTQEMKDADGNVHTIKYHDESFFVFDPDTLLITEIFMHITKKSKSNLPKCWHIDWINPNGCCAQHFLSFIEVGALRGYRVA